MSQGLDLTLRFGTPDYPVLDAYRRARNRFDCIRGPLGSGKTYASVQRILQTMIEQQPNAQGVRYTRGLATRNTYPDLNLTTIKDFMALFQPLGNLTHGGAEPPTFKMDVRLDDGTRANAEMVFLALDRDDAVRRLRGSQLTFGWVNEGKELVKSVVDMLDLRIGRYPSLANGGSVPSYFGVMMDTNAWDEDHYLEDWAMEPPPGYVFHVQPGGIIKDEQGNWVQNPRAENLANLPENYYINGMRGKRLDWILVNLANQIGFSLDGKPVYPEYQDSVHCFTGNIPFDPKLPILLGIDFGRTPAAAIGQYIPQWGRTVVIDEFVTEDMSQAQFGPELKRYLDQNYPGEAQGWCDPSGDSEGQATDDTPRQILVAAGVPAQPAPHKNSPTIRRACIANPLTRLCMDGKPALMISPKCRMIRKGLAGGYHFRRMKVAGSERFTDKPDKNMYSHVVEGLECLLSGLGEGAKALRPAGNPAIDEDDGAGFQEGAVNFW